MDVTGQAVDGAGQLEVGGMILMSAFGASSDVPLHGQSPPGPPVPS